MKKNYKNDYVNQNYNTYMNHNSSIKSYSQNK